MIKRILLLICLISSSLVYATHPGLEGYGYEGMTKPKTQVCFEECLPFMPLPFGDLQSQEYKDCYKRCKCK